MSKWIVNGEKELNGKVRISGSKNALLPILAASVVTKSIITLENVPPLKDTYSMINIMHKLQVKTYYDNNNKLIIDARGVKYNDLINEEVKNLRASYYFMGALLALFCKARVDTPGGCNFSKRPIDLHLFAFEELGYKYIYDKGIYTFEKTKKRKKKITFSKVSVGATVNAILASLKIRGKVVIENVAIEPEIDDFIYK